MCGVKQKQSRVTSVTSGYYCPPPSKKSKTMSLQQHQLGQMPGHVLREKSLIWDLPVDGLEFAARMDDEDPMAPFRQLFTFPKMRDLPYGEFLLSFLDQS